MKLEIFKRRLGWYWRVRAFNGRIVMVGAEPFASKRNARRSFHIALWRLATAYGFEVSK